MRIGPVDLLTILGQGFLRRQSRIVQDIDAASMQLWAKWRMHKLEADFTDGSVAGKQKFEDVNMGVFGALIFF